MNAVATIGLIFALSANLFLGCQRSRPENSDETPSALSQEPSGKKAPVQVEFYLMSKCPHGTKALLEVIRAKEKLGDSFDLKIDYIGVNLVKSDRPFASLHGQPEIEGNIVQLCAAKTAPAKHLAFLTCMNKALELVPSNWKSCAKSLGIDEGALTRCKDSELGKKLLYESFKRGNREETVASPTILINGKLYPGARSKNQLVRAICSFYPKANRPKACTELPDLSKLNVVAITDKRCQRCNLSSTLQRLKQALPGISPKILDWSDPSAKKLLQTAQIDLLPVILFDTTLAADSETAKDLADWIQKAEGGYHNLKIPAFFDPTAEICDNGKDDTGNGKTDCQDTSCLENLACRPEKKGQVNLFLTSHCPWGRQALKAMNQLMKEFSEHIVFNINYIASEVDGVLQSAHGAEEIAEDIRQLCIAKHYPKDYKVLKYIACRNENIRDPAWRRCTNRTGIDAEVVETCKSGVEGQTLLKESIKAGNTLNIQTSPTWLINNKYIFKSISATDLRHQFCQHNKLKACDKQPQSHQHSHQH